MRRSDYPRMIKRLVEHVRAVQDELADLAKTLSGLAEITPQSAAAITKDLGVIENQVVIIHSKKIKGTTPNPDAPRPAPAAKPVPAAERRTRPAKK
jgi:hypothetical protein